MYEWRFDISADTTFEMTCNFWGSDDISLFPRVDEDGIMEHGGSRHLDKAKSDEEALYILKSLNIIFNGCRFIESGKMKHKWNFFGLSKKCSDKPPRYTEINQHHLFGKNSDSGDYNFFHRLYENASTHDEEREKQECFINIINNPFRDEVCSSDLKHNFDLSCMFSFSRKNSEFRGLAMMCGLIDFTTIENQILSWGMLYKIAEYVNSVGKELAKDKKHLVIPKDKQAKFKNASNNYSILGFMSRHGNLKYNLKENKDYSTDIREYAKIVFEGAGKLYEMMGNN